MSVVLKGVHHMMSECMLMHTNACVRVRVEVVPAFRSPVPTI